MKLHKSFEAAKHLIHPFLHSSPLGPMPTQKKSKGEEKNHCEMQLQGAQGSEHKQIA